MSKLVLFSGQRGSVTAFPDYGVPGKLALRLGTGDNSRWPGFQTMSSIITRVVLSAQSNIQLQHHWDSDAFIYVFGDRVNGITISGLAFDSICNDFTDTLGIERVIAYYNLNRVSNRKTPIRVGIGSRTVIPGYLLAMEARIEDPSQRVWSFTLQMVGIPEPTRSVSKTKTSFMKKGGEKAKGKVTIEITEGEGEDIVTTEKTDDTESGGGGDSTSPDTPYFPNLARAAGNWGYPTGSDLDIGGRFSVGTSTGKTPTGWDTYGTGPKIELARGFTND